MSYIEVLSRYCEVKMVCHYYPCDRTSWYLTAFLSSKRLKRKRATDLTLLSCTHCTQNPCTSRQLLCKWVRTSLSCSDIRIHVLIANCEGL